ncbi:hypothetical protein [Paracoccus sp. T5]
MSPVPAQGGGEGRETEFLFRRGPSSFVGKAGDHRTVDAQIIQIAGRQGVQFTHGLAVNGAAGAVFLHALDRGQQAATQAVVGGGVLCLGDNSHCRILSVRLVFAVPGLARRFVDPKMALMLRMHNARFANAAMQKMHALG